MGGYFILNGIERLVRMLIMQRRNFVSTIRHVGPENAKKNPKLQQPVSDFIQPLAVVQQFVSMCVFLLHESLHLYDYSCIITIQYVYLLITVAKVNVVSVKCDAVNGCSNFLNTFTLG